MPKLASASTPSVWPPPSRSKRREAVPMPPLKPKALMPVPAPTAPSATGPEAAASSAREGVAFRQRARPDVGQIAVIAFEHDRIDRAGLAADVGIGGECPRHQCVEAGADGQGVAQQQRRLDLAELGELHQPGALAEAVDDIDGRADLPGGTGCRHGGSSAVKPGAEVAQLSVRCPTLTPGNIGDRIERPRLHDAAGQAEIAQALCHGARYCAGAGSTRRR